MGLGISGMTPLKRVPNPPASITAVFNEEPYSTEFRMAQISSISSSLRSGKLPI